MKVCGLTGGIGMGKSTAAGFFRAQNVKVVDTDALARQLVEPDQPVLAEISSIFGPGILDVAGKLRRDRLAQIVFADPDARKKLEDLLHPRIRESWLKQIEAWRQENCSLALVVIPLLFETRAETHFEKIICVACSAAAQHERLAARGLNPQQIEQRIAAQMPVEQKMARSDFVIWTDGAPEIHQRQIQKVFRALSPEMVTRDFRAIK